MFKDRTSIGTLLYRKQRLDDKYEQIRNLLSGSDQLFEELIRTPSGRYSKPKIQKLTDGFIGCLEDYRAYRKARFTSADAKMEAEKLNKEDRKFYEAFFHMVIGLALFNNNCPDGKLSKPGTWNAIMERIDEAFYYSDPAELYRDLICFDKIPTPLNDYPFRPPVGIWFDILCAYEAVTGDPLVDLITGEDRKKAYGVMSDAEAKLLKKEEKSPGTIEKMAEREQEEFDRMVEEYYAEWDEAIKNGEADPEAEEPVEEDDWEEEYYYDHFPVYDEDENEVKWRQYFSDQTGFRSECRILLKEMVTRSQDKDLFKEASNAVHLYLAQSGITGWLDDDDYFTVYTYLNKALKASGKKLGRE